MFIIHGSLWRRGRFVRSVITEFRVMTINENNLHRAGLKRFLCLRLGVFLAFAGFITGPVRAQFALGTASSVVGSGAGGSSVVLVAPSITWSASVSYPGETPQFITLNSSSGSGSKNFTFRCDANSGTPRYATITISASGQQSLTLNVTQAGTSYAQVTQPSSLVPQLFNPVGVAVDGQGNIYIADSGNNAIKEWSSANQTLITLIAGLNHPAGVAADSAGDVYIADTGNNAIKEWVAGVGLITLVSSGLTGPQGVAVDNNGNVYIADTGGNDIKEWSLATKTLQTLVNSGQNLYTPYGVAVDNTSGYVWIVDTKALKVYKGSGNPTPMYTVGCGSVALDLAGNVFFTSGSKVYEMVSGGNGETPLPLSSQFSGFGAVAVDSHGNVYAADTKYNVVWEQSGGSVTPVVSSPLLIENNSLEVSPYGIAVDGSGDVYAVCSSSGADSFLCEWSPDTQKVTSPLLSGTSSLYLEGVTLDGSGNVYVAAESPYAGTYSVYGSADNWGEIMGTSSENGPSGTWNFPDFIAADAGGDLYLGNDNANNDSIYELMFNATTLIAPYTTTSANEIEGGMTVDVAGNVYIAADGEILNLTMNENSALVMGSGLGTLRGLAVDGTGSLYFVNDFDEIEKWSPVNALSSLFLGSSEVDVGYNKNLGPNFWGVAADTNGDVYFSDEGKDVVEELPNAFVNTATITEDSCAGSDAVQAVLPTTANLQPPFNPVSDQAWLNIGSVNNGVVNFSFSANDAPDATLRTAHILLMGRSITVNQNPGACSSTTINFCSNTRFEGPNAGSDSVTILPADSSWRAFVGANSPWLQLPKLSGSGNVVFTYGANGSLVPLTGTIYINGQVVTVTQAGSDYKQVTESVDLPLPTGGQGSAYRIAVDASGNVYYEVEAPAGTVEEWTLAENTTAPAPNPLSGNPPPSWGVLASDSSGNIYIQDGSGNIYKWASGNVTTVISSSTWSGWTTTFGPLLDFAADGSGNIYLAFTNDIEEWPAESPQNLTCIAQNPPPNNPFYTVTSDCAGDLYYAVRDENSIYGWSPSSNIPKGESPIRVPPGTLGPESTFDGFVADEAGNLYADNSLSPFDDAIEEWDAANNTVTTLVPTSSDVEPYNLAVDGAGNVYFQNLKGGAIAELPYAFVDNGTVYVPAAGGTFPFPVVPSTLNLLPPFSPSPPNYLNSMSAWITYPYNIAAGSPPTFFCQPNCSGQILLAQITVLGQTFTVSEAAGSGTMPCNESFERTERPIGGRDSFVLAASGAWSATANDNWLHLDVTNGTGSMNVSFSFDTNTGPTRSGTLTIAGETFIVTQAGSTYVQAPGPLTTLVSSNLDQPWSVAVDSAGNVYIADQLDNAIREWTPANNTVTTLVSSNLNQPEGVAVDSAGDVYIADSYNNAIKEWIASSGAVVTLFSNVVQNPYGVAVDGAGNVYVADWGDDAVEEWMPANSNLVTLVSSANLNGPTSVSLDAADNVYISDYFDNRVLEWTAANSNLTTLFNPLSGRGPNGVAVDNGGNVLVADEGNFNIEEWMSATSNLVSLVTNGLNTPQKVAVDAWDNIYIADRLNNAVEELPYAFVDPTPKMERSAAGSDTLPPVVPADINLLPPFYPSSDQPWLGITGTAGGVVSFSFDANTGVVSRTAHITLLGQQISVTQAPTLPVLTSATPSTGARKGTFELTFSSGSEGATFEVISSTNILLPVADWSVVGMASNIAPGFYQFSTQSSNVQCFYMIRSP